jgi:hypothetical protein
MAVLGRGKRGRRQVRITKWKKLKKVELVAGGVG